MSEPRNPRVLKDIVAPMRDGVRLYADIYLPEHDGRFPVLLQRTPYGKGSSIALEQLGVERAVARGYAVIIQDTRGRYPG